jgi:N-acetylglucosaminyl-diphospho-decaprenol L-rhamnosyltransferase
VRLADTADVDAVLVSYRSGNELPACVEPLLEAGAHVTVVDNASGDGSLDAVSGLPVDAVQLDDNRGFAHGCNVGWRRGTAPYVLFLNPDARLDVSALRQLVHTIDSNDGIGVTAPLIVGEDGALHHSLRRFARLRSTYARAFFVHRLLPNAEWTDELVHDRDAYEHPGSPEWVSGACMLVRRTALEHVGGWDERFFLYREDMDLCRRIRAAGWDVRFEPGARCMHVGGASAPRTALYPVLAESRVRYARKHARRPAQALERVGVGLEALTHSLVGRGGPPARAGHARAFLRVASRLPRT